MKKLILGGFAIVLIITIAYFVYGFFFAERVSPADSAEFTAEGVEMKIDYSRPFKKGRLIFGPESEGALQPYGVYWRLGANEATKLTTIQPISIMGNTLEQGSYAMYAFPGEELWIIGFNAESEDWGYFEPDYAKDVFRIEVEPTKSDSVVEQLTISIEGLDDHLAEIKVSWDDVILRIPVDRIP